MNTIPIDISPKRIPSREEYHQEYAGEITASDFNTHFPNRLRIPALSSACRFNECHRQRLLAKQEVNPVC